MTALAYSYWLPYPANLWCGPSQAVYVAVVSKGPGTIQEQAAIAGPNSRIEIISISFNAGGSNLTPYPSRYLNSYDVHAYNGARLVATGYGCYG